MMKQIYRFRPEVIYTVGESTFAVNASLRLARRLKIPVVIHYMDNWRDTLYPDVGLLKIARRIFMRDLARLQDRVTNALVISRPMKRAYDARDQTIVHRVLANTVEGMIDRQPPRINPGPRDLTFVYLGGLHLNRWEGLLSIEECIAEMNAEGVAARLLIYTSDEGKIEFERYFNRRYTEFCGFLEHSDVVSAYERADVLVHVESFRDIDSAYTKYSLSTKIPECMALGKPILCYAPSGLAVSEYVRESTAGFACDNLEDLKKSTFRLAVDAPLRAELGLNGLITAKQNHSKGYALEVLAASFE